MSTPRPDDAERDAWLSEALRHAPDAHAAPPSALSDAILRQARAATNAPRAPARSAWAAVWAWLARPPVAAGFASVMVATLIGLMWWDQPIDPTVARAPAAEATPAAPVAAAAPTPSPEAAPERHGPAPNAERRTTADAVAAAQSKIDRAREERPAPGTAGALGRSAAAKAAAPTAQRADNLVDARPAAFDALLASAAAQPDRWGWERSGAAQPMSPALQRWLAQLDAATSAVRWGAVSDTASSGEASVLRLYRDGAPAATLRLDDESVGLVPGPRASLPRATLDALKQALDEATR